MSTENKEDTSRVGKYKQRETNKTKAVEANRELQKEERMQPQSQE